MFGAELQITRDVSDIRAQLDRVEKKLDTLLRLLPLLLAGDLPQPSEQVNSLLRSGHRLQAIKSYREQSGLSAEQAEAALDAVRHKQESSDRHPT